MLIYASRLGVEIITVQKNKKHITYDNHTTTIQNNIMFTTTATDTILSFVELRCPMRQGVGRWFRHHSGALAAPSDP